MNEERIGKGHNLWNFEGITSGFGLVRQECGDLSAHLAREDKTGGNRSTDLERLHGAQTCSSQSQSQGIEDPVDLHSPGMTDTLQPPEGRISGSLKTKSKAGVIRRYGGGPTLVQFLQAMMEV
jgi:hypothetical protein